MATKFQSGPGKTSAASDDEFSRHMAESSLESIKAWLEPFDGKFYSYGYTMMFLKLIATPGVKKSELALFLEVEAKVSRSTAERFISDASEAGYINISKREDGPGLEIFLSDDILGFFSKAFQKNLERGANRIKLYGSGRIETTAA
jgi:hypothetical protein